MGGCDLNHAAAPEVWHGGRSAREICYSASTQDWQSHGEMPGQKRWGLSFCSSLWPGCVSQMFITDSGSAPWEAAAALGKKFSMWDPDNGWNLSSEKSIKSLRALSKIFHSLKWLWVGSDRKGRIKIRENGKVVSSYLTCWKRDRDHLSDDGWEVALCTEECRHWRQMFRFGFRPHRWEHRKQSMTQFHLSIGMATVGYCDDWIHIIKHTISLVIFISSILCG